MDMNLSLSTFEHQSTDDPIVLSSPPLSEFEILELPWKKGPAEKPLTTPLQLENELAFIGDDEMAMWLHYPMDDPFDMATAGQPMEVVVPSVPEPVRMGDEAPSTCEEQVGSSDVARMKRTWKEITGLHRDNEGSELEVGDKSSISRAHKAKVHNLSERRRRGRINEKLKALQELIPRCNKSDKVSMLGEAIGYVKSLQKQVQSWQMMSMGCNMRPLMFPSGLPCMPPPMNMNMGMNMNMNMNMGKNGLNMNNVGLNMLPFGPVMPVQPTMMPMQHQHNMFQPCHFPFVVPGQFQAPSHSSSHQKMEKGASRKQVASLV